MYTFQLIYQSPYSLHSLRSLRSDSLRYRFEKLTRSQASLHSQTHYVRLFISFATFAALGLFALFAALISLKTSCARFSHSAPLILMFPISARTHSSQSVVLWWKGWEQGAIYANVMRNMSEANISNGVSIERN